MNLFSTDYLSKVTNLLKEAFKFKKYKAMHPFFAVVVGITVIPFVLVSLLLSVYLIIACFLSAFLSAFSVSCLYSSTLLKVFKLYISANSFKI